MTAPGHPATRNSRLLGWLGRTALRAAGWRIVGEVPRAPKFVAIVAPHTSNWDFLVGLAVLFALDLRVHWLGKHTIFRGPAGWVLRRLGGRPVRRETPEGVVAQVVEGIQREPSFILALAPEGTRSRVGRWRTGFYQIAAAAGVPIVPVWFDFSRREVGLGAPLQPTGDASRDLAILRATYHRGMALYPELFSEHDVPD